MQVAGNTYFKLATHNRQLTASHSWRAGVPLIEGHQLRQPASDLGQPHPSGGESLQSEHAKRATRSRCSATRADRRERSPRIRCRHSGARRINPQGARPAARATWSWAPAAGARPCTSSLARRSPDGVLRFHPARDRLVPDPVAGLRLAFFFRATPARAARSRAEAPRRGCDQQSRAQRRSRIHSTYVSARRRSTALRVTKLKLPKAQ